MDRIPSPHRLLRLGLAACLALLCLLGSADPAGAEQPDEDHLRTLGVAAAYRNAPNWVVRSIALLSLGERWHPAGTEMVLDALRSGDARLRIFAIEALRATSGDALRTVLSTELLDELITRQLADKNKYVEAYVRGVLTSAFPTFGKTSLPWRKWWKGKQLDYTPAPWVDRPKKKPERAQHGTVARKSVVTRALELSRDGIELVLCFDSTGSMQPTIDSARTAMVDVVDVLQGLSPDMRVGVVHYRDRGDIGGKGEAQGAAVLSKLTSNLRSIPRILAKVQAGGGGDLPERVYAGLWLSLHRDMGWTPRAAKMVVLIGDAPSRPEDFDAAVELVRVARTETAWKLNRRWKKGKPAPVTTGRKRKPGQPPPVVNPILTSCICAAAWKVDEEAAAHFRKLAAVGGGVYAELTGRMRLNDTSAGIVQHLVELTFGRDYRAAAERLAARYVFWKKKGLFK